MSDVVGRLATVRERIRAAEARFSREPGSVALLAVSKRQPPEALHEALAAGQHAFGENYLQEALAKREALADCPVEWHLVGPLQSNKTKPAAECFDWIHTLDRLKVARRLSAHRPAERPPMNCCLQVNVSGEASKSGIAPEQAPALAEAVDALPGLRLRGLMTLPAPAHGLGAQREPLRQLRELLERINAGGLGLDTLSMGMSDDLEAAVAEGATIVRIGTAVFGPRPPG